MQWEIPENSYIYRYWMVEFVMNYKNLWMALKLSILYKTSWELGIK